MKHALVFVLFASLLLGGGPAFAAEEDVGKQYEARSAAAMELFKAGQYDAAIAQYLEAYALIESGEPLYNVAYIYDKKLNKPSLALDFYRRVLRMPDSSADLVRRSATRVSEIEADEARRTADARARRDAANAGATTVNKAGPPDDTNYAPWVVIGGGGALIVGGLVAGLVAGGTHSDYEASRDPAQRASLKSDGQTQTAIADGLIVTGAVAATAGIIWLLVDDGDDPAEAVPPVSVGPTGDGSGVIMSWGTSL